MRIVIVLVVSSILSCVGWTYIPVSDIDLISSSDSIILGTINSRIDGNHTDIKGPWTHYSVGVSFLLKSNDAFKRRFRSMDSFSNYEKSSLPTHGHSIVVSVIGGLDYETGNTLHVTAAPTFSDGDTVLLFLTHDDTSGVEINQITHFALGAFHKMDITSQDATSAQQVSSVFIRTMDISGVEDDGTEVSVRKYAEFIQFIVKQISVGTESSDDEIKYQSKTTFSGLKTSPHFPRFNTFKYQQNTIRWRIFDEDLSGSVAWSSLESGQIGLEGGAAIEIKQAMTAWNDQPNTPINYQSGPPTDSLSAFYYSDNINSILFEDPKNVIAGKYQCGIGGTLALGGWWTNGDEYTFRGIQFTEIIEADIVLQDGIGCWFSRQTDPSASYSNLITHEMGHTLGLDHSCGDSDGSCVQGSLADSSVMRAFVHNNAGAFLGEDDNSGIEYIYSECYPYCPTNDTVNDEIAVSQGGRKVLGLNEKHTAIIASLVGFVVIVAIVVVVVLIVVKKRKEAQRQQVRSRSSSLIIDPYDHIDIPGYVVGAHNFISPARMSYYDHFAAVSNNLKQQENAADNQISPKSHRNSRPYSTIDLNLQNQQT